MPRKTRKPQPAPTGYVWTTEAADRMRLSKQTLYNYNHLGIGPQPDKYRGRLVYKIADIDAWMADELNSSPASERPHESRPAEPRRMPRKPATSRSATPVAA